MNATEVLAEYRPHATSPAHAIWSAQGDFIRSAVAATFPASASSTAARLRVVGLYVAWCTEQEQGLTPETIFTEDLTEAFFASGWLAVQSLSTYRSHLRAVAKANTRRAIWTATPETLPHSAVRDPYTPEEVHRYLALIEQQSTDRKRRVLDCVLHLGLGAGLTAPEMLTLPASAVRRCADLVVVDVGDRTVPVRAAFREDVMRLAEETRECPCVR